MQDVGAYVIARTLGVVETTRASTSDIKRADETPVESDDSEMDGTQVDIVESPEREEAFLPESAAVDTDPVQKGDPPTSNNTKNDLDETDSNLRTGSRRATIATCSRRADP